MFKKIIFSMAAASAIAMASTTPTISLLTNGASTTSVSGTTPFVINFTADLQLYDTNLSKITWDFNDSSTLYTSNVYTQTTNASGTLIEQLNSHTFTKAGNYTVTVNGIDDQNNSVTVTENVLVTDPAIVYKAPVINNINLSATTGTSPFIETINASISKYNTNLTSVIIDFGDGNSSSNLLNNLTTDSTGNLLLSNIKYSYNNPGTYTITLKVLDDNNNSITSQQNLTVSAAAAQYFTVNTSSNITNGWMGNITISPTAAQYKNGDTITLTATPKAGYVFKGWSGDAIGTDTNITLTVNKNMVIGAKFDYPTFHYLSVKKNSLPYDNGANTVSYSPSKNSYSEGEVVTITANAGSGYVFEGFTGDTVASTNSITVKMDTNKNLQANFAKYYTINTSTSTNGSITIAPQKDTYRDGDKVTITAVPDSGYKFQSWNGNYGSSYTTSFIIHENKNLQANFVYDSTPPKVTLNSPINNVSLSGTMNVTATIVNSDPNYLPDLYIDGSFYAKMLSTSANNNFSYTLDTTTLLNKYHTMQIKTKTINGVVGNSAISNFKVDNYSTTVTPKVTITNPVNGDTLTDTITINAQMAGIDSLKKAVLYVDGSPYGAVLTAAPWDFKLATAALRNGNHSVKIEAVTTEGKLISSNSVYVHTQNTVWSNSVTAHIVSPINGDTRGAKFNLTLAADAGDAISKIDVYIDNNDIPAFTSKNATSIPIDLTAYADGKHTIKVYVETANGVIGYANPVTIMLKNSCKDGSTCGAGTPLNLITGWNLLSSPLKGISLDMSVFKSSSIIKSLWIYDTFAGYKGYAKGSLNQINSIPSNSGFWINSTQEGSVNVTSTMPPAPIVDAITYNKGWNLLGAPNGYVATDFFKACPEVTNLYVFRSGNYAIYRTSDNTDTITQISPTEGFWLYANKPATCGSGVTLTNSSGSNVPAVPTK